MPGQLAGVTERGRLHRARARLEEELPTLDWFPVDMPGDESEAVLAGQSLWQQACEQVRAGQTDDRWLYWQRLAYVARLIDTSHELARSFENASRGYDAFKADFDIPTVLVTGFDPFHLDTHIDQANPSGMIAQSLDNLTREVGGQEVLIRTALVPVRFGDFDENLIEQLFESAVSSPQVKLIVTVSMGRTDFDLERFPGLRRSSGNPDNENVLTGDSADNPLVPPGLEGPEFVEFSLPVAAMRKVEGDFRVNDNCSVSTRDRGDFTAKRLEELAGETCVRGGGGGYLSNEISYRLINLANKAGSTIPMGHIHTPRIAGMEQEKMQLTVHQCTELIDAAIEMVV